MALGQYVCCPGSTGLYFEKTGIGEIVRTSNEINVIMYIVFGLAVFKI